VSHFVFFSLTNETNHVTVSVQRAPTANEAPQVLVSEKTLPDPTKAIELIKTVVLPTLVKATVRATVVPTFCTPKLKTGGVI
jgi:hypothetical protein